MFKSSLINIMFMTCVVVLTAGPGEQCRADGKLPITDFVLSDGAVNLEGIRATGYEGGLDLSSGRVFLDPTTGEPVVTTAGRDIGDNDYWADGFHSRQLGGPGDVYCMAVYNGDLIVGGYFQTAGDTIARNIAAWDGTNWSRLAGGISGTYRDVYALEVYDGWLYVGGDFQSAGGPARNFAAWDGTEWHQFGNFMNDRVYDLHVWNDLLVVGGAFTKTPDNTDVNLIATWDGVSWGTLGTGITGSNDSKVMCLDTYDGDLVAAGFFSQADGSSAGNLAAWNGSGWSELGGGAWGFVYDMVVWDSKLVVDGGGGKPLAAWDGASWTTLIDYIDAGDVRGLEVHDGQLLAYGHFDDIEGVPMSGLIQWLSLIHI